MQRRSLHPIWGSLRLQRDSQVPLREQIVSFYRSAIREGRLPAGMQVRSSREFASEHRISRTTAVQAYEKLVEEGYLVTRQGAGVFVAIAPPEAFTLNTLRTKPVRSGNFAKAALILPKRAVTQGLGSGTSSDPAEDPPDFSNVDGRRYELPLSPGMPALDQFPWHAWSRISNRVFRDRPLNALGYGDPQGELPLRESVAQYLAESRGIVCSAAQIAITSGTEQTLEFLATQLAEPGDEVWFEDPSYPFVRRVLRAARLNAVPVRVDDAGICVTDGLVSARTARVAIVSPTHQYPLGVTMSLARRQELIEWSRRCESWIIENEIDGDYRYTPNPIPPIFVLSDTDRVIYCGSLSKPLAPGLRVNYFVAPVQAIRSFALRSTLVPMFTQLVLARFDAEGYLASHMNKMRRLYGKRRSLLLDCLRSQARELLDVDRVPEAGLRITAGLKTRSDDAYVSAACLRLGVRVDPLSVCYDRDPRLAGIIVGFASTPEEKLERAVRKLVDILTG